MKAVAIVLAVVLLTSMAGAAEVIPSLDFEGLKKLEVEARVLDRVRAVEKKLEEVDKLFLPLEERELIPGIWEKLLQIVEKFNEVSTSPRSTHSLAEQKLLQEINKTLGIIEQELERYLTLKAPKG